MRWSDKMSYDPLNKGGRDPETGGEPRATMSDEHEGRAPRSAHGQTRITSRKSVLRGAELYTALQVMDVSQLLLARHSGSHEVTINRFCSGKVDGDIPLWIERILLSYWWVPWSKRVRGRIRLPLREWGIERDDDDPEAEDEHGAPNRRPSTAPYRTISWLIERWQAVYDDPDSAKEIAREVLESMRKLPRQDDGDSGGTGPTPAEPWGSVNEPETD